MYVRVARWRSGFIAAACGALLALGLGSATAQSEMSAVEAFHQATSPSAPYSLPHFWAATFPEIGATDYVDPTFIGSADSLDAGVTACGSTATSMAGNAEYCPADGSIAFDDALLSYLHTEFGPAASIAVLAHEWGHHVQAHMARPSVSQRSELQADCYAGMYVGHLVDAGILTPDDVLGSLASTEGAGDDAYGATSYLEWHDSGVHGASNTRRQAFGTGYQTGDPELCLAYRQWAPQPPLVLAASSLSADRQIELPAGAFTEILGEDAYTIETPQAYVQLHTVWLDPATEPSAAVRDALDQAWGTDEVYVDDIVEGWLDIPGWSSGLGARGVLYNLTDEGSRAEGAVGLQIHQSGEADLFVAVSTSPWLGDPVTTAGHALDSLGWGYCDYAAPVPDNCALRPAVDAGASRPLPRATPRPIADWEPDDVWSPDGSGAEDVQVQDPVGQKPLTNKQIGADLKASLPANLTCKQQRKTKSIRDPLKHEAKAAIICDRLESQWDLKLDYIALFRFEDWLSMFDYWWVRRSDNPPMLSNAWACADGKRGYGDWAHGVYFCYVTKSGTAILRWTDKRTNTYGVLDAVAGNRNLKRLHQRWVELR